MTPPERSRFHALRFGRAAARYEEHAGLQSRMADTLLSLWGERAAPSRILEFGCGTGLLTRRLRARFPQAGHLATDAAPEMLEHARKAFQEGQGDGRRAPVFSVLDARGGVASWTGYQENVAAHAALLPADLVAAGAVVQWFPDLAAHLRFAASCAAPGAAYLVSGFDRDNFPELNTLLAEPPFSYRDFPGHAPAAVEAAAAAAGWSVAGMLSWEEREVWTGARAVLKRVQDLGAVRDPRSGGRMTRAGLAHLLVEYERRFAMGGAKTKAGEPPPVSLTWKPWAALLTRD